MAYMTAYPNVTGGGYNDYDFHWYISGPFGSGDYTAYASGSHNESLSIDCLYDESFTVYVECRFDIPSGGYISFYSPTYTISHY